MNFWKRRGQNKTVSTPYPSKWTLYVDVQKLYFVMCFFFSFKVCRRVKQLRNGFLKVSVKNSDSNDSVPHNMDSPCWCTQNCFSKKSQKTKSYNSGKNAFSESETSPYMNNLWKKQFVISRYKWAKIRKY